MTERLLFQTYLAPEISPNPIVAKIPAMISIRGCVASLTITIVTIIKAILGILKAKLNLEFLFYS